MCWFGKKKPKKKLKEEAFEIKTVIHRAFEMVDKKRINYDAKIDALEKELEKMKNEIKAKRKLVSETELTSMLDVYERKQKICNGRKEMRNPIINLSNLFSDIDYIVEYCCDSGVYSALVKTMDKKTREKLEEMISGDEDFSDLKQITAVTELVANKISEFMRDLKIENERAADNLASLMNNAKSDNDNEVTKKSANDRFADMFGDDEEENKDSGNNMKKHVSNDDDFELPAVPKFDNDGNSANNSRKANNN